MCLNSNNCYRLHTDKKTKRSSKGSWIAWWITWKEDEGGLTEWVLLQCESPHTGDEKPVSLDCNSEPKSDHVLDSFSFHLYETTASKTVSQMQEISAKPACRSKQTSKNMQCFCLLVSWSWLSHGQCPGFQIMFLHMILLGIEEWMLKFCSPPGIGTTL